MNEFALIDAFFKKSALEQTNVVFGIGDDAACLNIPAHHHLLVSTDTLVADVHFLSSFDAYDIASKAVRVNVSDMAAMAATPHWLTLALTMPSFKPSWIKRFAEGLHDTLKQFGIVLIGGDTTCGPLSLTLTIMGLVPQGKAVRRCHAKLGDKIYVSGPLGAAALAVAFLNQDDINKSDMKILMHKLQHPHPRVDLAQGLQTHASAAIDISDGLSADLHHICEASNVGANLNFSAIPVHPLVIKYKGEQAVYFALVGGDDYEVCFTVPAEKEGAFIAMLAKQNLSCYPIGEISAEKGLRLIMENNEIVPFMPQGYSHFT